MVLFQLSVPLTVHAYNGDCYLPGVLIEYSNEYDYECACAAIRETRHFLEQYPIQLDQILYIRFKDNLYINHYNEHGTYILTEEVTGSYDRMDGTILMLSMGSRATHIPSFLGTEVTKEIYISMIAHEIAHSYLDSHHLKSNSFLPDRATHEFFAYTVQFEVLTESTRKHLLDHWREYKFGSNEAINSIVYLGHPDRFGVMAYRYSRTHQSMKQIIAGKFISGDYMISQEEADHDVPSPRKRLAKARW